MAMKRGYTALEYKSTIRKLRAVRPGLSLSSDFIVGFPGETDEDFEGSLALLRRARFDNAYAFAFSPRPHTVAARRLGSGPDWLEVPRAVTAARLERLQRLQGEITAERLRAELGREVEVLVEGIGDDGSRRFGRTGENRLVHFDASEAEAPVGALLRVRVVHAGQASLGGELLNRAGAAA
jgi:tRNA-2-methylthio-N6-dimethylallyladenosine synthase